MRSSSIFYDKNRRIINSVSRMKNESLLSHAYNASLYLSFREDLFIFGYILQALEELDDNIERENIDNLMASIHLSLLSGYHTYNLPMYYNRDRDTVTNKDTLHKYCNESIAELIIIILSRKGINRLLGCKGVNKGYLIKLIRLMTEHMNTKNISDMNNYLKSDSREALLESMICEEMYRVFRLSFIGFEILRGVYPRNELMLDIDKLSEAFSKIYILTYTDLHKPYDTIQSCNENEEKFTENKSIIMEILLKRNYYNRSFGNILQFIERQFLCKIRDSMRQNTRRII